MKNPDKSAARRMLELKSRRNHMANCSKH